MERVLADTDKVIVDEKAGSGVVPYLPLSEFTKKSPPQAPTEGSQP
jgi:membrane protease subunit HflK